MNSGKPILSIFCFSRFQAAVLALLLAMVPGTWAQNPAVNVADDRSTTSAAPTSNHPRPFRGVNHHAN